jgi:cell division ATP-binding protein FtsE
MYLRGARPALDQVSVDIERGEFVFLVGASGSGKSTFLRLVLREERPTSGTVFVAGRDLSRLNTWKVPHLRRTIGMVFQDFRLLPNKTVYENVAFALQVIGAKRHAIATRVPEVLELVGLEGKAKRRPHELSGGEQQRVAIARAVVNRPALLLADEPTGNLDPTTSLGIMRLLNRISSTGTTVVMATHDSSIVNEMRKRVVELDDGHIARDELAGGYMLNPDADVSDLATAGLARETADDLLPVGAVLNNQVASPADGPSDNNLTDLRQPPVIAGLRSRRQSELRFAEQHGWAKPQANPWSPELAAVAEEPGTEG